MWLKGILLGPGNLTCIESLKKEQTLWLVQGSVKEQLDLPGLQAGALSTRWQSDRGELLH